MAVKTRNHDKSMHAVRERLRILRGVLIPLVAAGVACTSPVDEHTRMQIVDENLARGDHTAAVFELTNILEANPDNARARLMLGETWLAAGRYSAAARQLEAAIERGAPEAAKLSLGRALIAMGKFDQVLSTLPEGSADPAVDAPLAALRVRALALAGDVSGATALLDESLERYPSDVDLNLAGAEMSVARDRLDLAERHIDTALSENPFSVRAHQLQGAMLFGRGRLAEAEKAFARAIDASGSAPQSEAILHARVGLAESQWRQGKASKALQNIKELIDGYPWHPLPRFLRAIVSYESGDNELVEEYLKDVLRGVPDHADSHRLLAAVNFALGRFESANVHLARLAELTGESEPMQELQAGTFLAMGNYRQAAATLTGLPADATADPALVLLRARALLYNGQAARAVPYFELSRQLAPGNLSLRARTINALISAGRLDDAAAELRRLPTRRTDEGVRERLELRLVAAGPDPERARRMAKTLREQDPSNLQVMLVLANLARQRGDLDRAIDWLQLARLKNPDSLEAVTLLAYTHIAQRAYIAAREIALEGTREHPYNALIYNALGEAQLGTGDFANALASLNRAAELAPRDPAILLNMARAQLKVNDFFTARTSMLRAVDLSDGDLGPVRSLVLEQQERGRGEQALALARELQARHGELPIGYQIEGDLLLAQSKFAGAADAYGAAARRSGDRLVAVQGYTAGRAAGLTDAAAVLEDWLRENPGDRRVMRILDKAE